MIGCCKKGFEGGLDFQALCLNLSILQNDATCFSFLFLLVQQIARVCFIVIGCLNSVTSGVDHNFIGSRRKGCLALKEAL